MSKNQKRLDPAFFIVFFILLILIGVGVIIAVSVRTDAFTARIENNPQVPVLLMFSDEDELISAELLLMDTKTNSAALYDIPRSIGSIIPSLERVDRIDNLYAELGAQELTNTVSSIVDLEIPFYLDLDLKDIEVLVDLLEGVTVFIPEPIDDEVDGSVVRFPGGNTRLDGGKVAQYIAYEGESDRDLEWISRRWTFVREFLRSLGTAQAELENPVVQDQFIHHLGASFDARAAQSFLLAAGSIDVDSLITQRVLGNERQVETGNGQETILFPHFEGQLVRDSITQVLGSLGEPEASYSAALSTTIELLNGTGVNGLAARTQELYQNYGFDVQKIGNADRDDYEQTIIIDRGGNREIAQRVGQLIRAENIIQGNPLSDSPEIGVTIILGQDFDGWYVNAPSQD